MHVGAVQIELVHAVMGDQLPVPAGVAEEDDVGRLEHLLLGVVLRGDEVAILQLLRKAVQVLGAVRLAARDVKAHHRLLVVHIGHVGDAALQNDGAVVGDKVVGEAGLAAVADGVGHPVDAPVVSRLREVAQHARLPRAGGKVDVGSHFIVVQRVAQGSKAARVLDERGRVLLRDSLDATFAQCEGSCVQVRALALRARREVAELKGTVDEGGVVNLATVVARLLRSAAALLKVRAGEVPLQASESHVAMKLDVALHVQVTVDATLERPNRVAHAIVEGVVVVGAAEGGGGGVVFLAKVEGEAPELSLRGHFR